MDIEKEGIIMENKILVSGITFRYDNLEITDEVLENIKDFIKDLKYSHDGIYDSFYVYEDDGKIIIY